MIGAGNVATHLAKALSMQAEIVQVFSAHLNNAVTLASTLPAAIATDQIDRIVSDADCYIISIKDDAIAPLLEKTTSNNALWVHTSGSVPATVFASRFSRYGVLYPLQTFTRTVPVDITQVPFFIEGSSDDTTNEIRRLAQLMSPSVYEADSEIRKQIHIAAVFACNYANHLWAIADEILGNVNLPFSILLPLIRATIDKAVATSPAEGQTGPARRGDIRILDSHIDMLPTDKAKIYRTLADSIINKYNSTTK